MFSSTRGGDDEAIRAAAHRLSYNYRTAPVAQMDRAIASGAIGREFESLRAHQIFLADNGPPRAALYREFCHPSS